MTTAESSQPSFALLSAVTAHLPAIALPDPENAPSHFEGAVLHIKIEGTVRLAENLAKAGREGAEQFGRRLNVLMARLLSDLEVEEGQVARLEGDELIAFFPQQANENLESCGKRARRVATRMLEQPVVSDLSVTPGTGVGRVYLLRFGSTGMGRELVLAGPALAQAQASTQLLKDWAEPGSLLRDEIIGRPDVGKEIEEQEEVIARLASWLPPAVWQRLKDEPNFAGNWERAVALCLKFDGPNYAEANGRQQLQEYYTLVQHICSVQGGLLYRYQPGENGEPHRMMIIFGTLLSYSDDAERALRAGLALRRLPEYLNFITNQSIGVASSSVFAGPIGTPQRRQFVVTGDALSSARLAAAEAGRNLDLKQQGAFLVDRFTSERVPLNFLFAEEQALEQPGKNFSVKTAPLLAERKFISALKRYWKDELQIVGRSQERAQLEQLASEALGGQTKAVIITGTEGSGKSALLGDASRQWLARGGLGAVGVCYQHGEGWPYLGWAGVLAWLCDFVDADTRMARVAKINTVISHYIPEYPELVAPVQQLLNVTPYDRALWKRMVTPGPDRDHFFELFVNLIEGKSAEQPLMIELENLQWSDGASQELLNHLIKQAQAAVLFGLTSREPFDSLPEGVAQIGLGPLDSEESRQLAELTAISLKITLTPEQLDQITTLAQGNQLQTIEAVRYWKQHHKLPTSIEQITLSRLAFGK